MIGQARRASAVISYNGKDISADIAPYLKSLSYRDNLSGEADDLQIVLEDRAGLWQSSWLPEKGASLDVTLKFSQWASLTGEKTFPLGAFEIDEISVSGYPSEVQIKAVSVPDGNTLRGGGTYPQLGEGRIEDDCTGYSIRCGNGTFLRYRR